MRDRTRLRRPAQRAMPFASSRLGELSDFDQRVAQPTGGHRLDHSTRATMEERFGHDFSQVRIHSDSQAAEVAEGLGALAYTAGGSIGFAAGRYQPGTTSGRGLIAHELVHVLQQSAGTGRATSRPDDMWERQADAVARRVDAGDRIAGVPLQSGAPPIQRRPLPGVAGTSLAEISLSRRSRDDEVARERLDVIADTEVAPFGESPGSFDGFQTIYEALVYAQRQERVTAIVKDKKQSADEPERYHVLVSRLDPVAAGSDRTQVIPYTHRDFALVRWMHLSRPGTSWQSWIAALGSPGGADGSWSDRARAAHKLREQYALRKTPEARKAAEQAFVPLLAEAIGIRPGEVNVVGPSNPERPDTINFDIDETANATTSGGIKRDPESGALQMKTPAITMGPGSVRINSPIPTQQTLVHEAAHATHASRANELLGEYARSSMSMSFEEWLKVELAKKRITQIDFELARESARGGSGVTELLSYVEGFVSGYHLLPADLDSLVLFEELNTMEDEFLSVARLSGYSRDSLEAVTAQIVERLRSYYQTAMDADHRRRFDEYVSSRLAAASEDSTRTLYKALASFGSGAPAGGPPG
jgi:hypothetical protein